MLRKLAVTALIVILGIINWSIFSKEQQLHDGQIVYLQLAPVDPRSLMQGDYMALRFTVAEQIYHALPKKEKHSSWTHDLPASDGYVVVSLDNKNIASYRRLYQQQPSENSERLLHYRVRNGAVKFASNAFFFQEGDGKLYSSAHYGQFRVSKEGELLLAGLFDKALNKLPIETEQE
ncbi:MAG: putative membrane-anchored protein [Psychromonas sp.]|jgi:uncharacterized membrane-anchored protein|uniref:GDYXXLXY domain-containing protein n=1 Tax=Psychromonas sp. TaxID=1884585 RepID=UPI0039E53295